MKHSRQVLIKDWDQGKVYRTSIFLGGLGAIGSSAAVIAARLGIERITLVDHDKLGEHNLENQMYTEKDIGKLKVDALKRIIWEIDRKIKVETYSKKVEELPEKAFEADFYLGCFDNFNARLYLNKISIRNNKPLILGGIEGFRDVIRTIVPKQTPCLECYPSLIPKPRPNPNGSCAQNPIPSTFITASHASDLMVMQLINLIFGWKVEPFLYFDLKNNICNSIPLSINPECICGADFNGKEHWK